MELKQVEVNSLKAYPENARTHNDKQVAQIADSIKEFGFCAPCLVDEKGVLIAGHGRVMAAQTLGLKTVPTISIEHLTPEQVKAYRLADNQLALNAGWDFELVGLELGELNENGFNLDLLGFDERELLAFRNPESLDETFDSDGVKEISEDDFNEFDHICPRCKFEFDEKK
jgi:ParB-like chromosome segregation protein Spo0J